VVAAAAGATYIAPYLAKLQEAGRDAVGEITAMQEVLAATGSPTRILLASIRDVASVVQLARHGVDHFTMGPTVAEQLFADELTAHAARVFEEAVRG
jgi:transaldolase